MIASGMADYGYQYVNIDDCWMKRQGDHSLPGMRGRNVAAEQQKFPRYQAEWSITSHGKGLKRGHLYFAGAVDMRPLHRRLPA